MENTPPIAITQITNNAHTIYGLGADNKVYQWNTIDSSWHLYALKKEAEQGSNSPLTK